MVIKKPANKVDKKSTFKSSNKKKNPFKSSFLTKNKDLIYRILFTLLALIIIRLGVYITVPGVTLDKRFATDSSRIQFFQLLSTLGGGSIGRFSILALGVSPYIAASIIVQLLSTDIIPVLTRWSKSGERGRKKLDKLTKIIMIPFALMQAEATIFTLSSQGLIIPGWDNTNAIANSAFYYILIPLVMLGGSFFMLWIADQITIKGIGNGISIVIFIGIIISMPSNLKSTFEYWVSNSGEEANIFFSGLLNFMIYISVFLLVILSVVIMNEAERKIPIQQTGSGLTDSSEHTPYLPLKLNNAGVIPVIFASAIISTPITISQIIEAVNPDSGFVIFTRDYLSFNTWWGISIFGILIVLFTFLYSQVQINPEKIAENFQKSGTFIPGIKPGKDTTKYLTGIINRLSVVGSVFLAIIALLPYVISKLTQLPSNLAIGGTGLIICISVAIQTVQQLKGRIIQQNFIEKKKEKFTNNINKNKTSHIW
ncbi:preprotein translocase subunit SecY [Mycoplasma capricolum]|uniref:Protein translocase subunit SecY n=1 Tax=Mycoplasma capricolum subsp. capripneumoniae 87001 TaxID=1124992 RepID=A0A9N7AV61_MYCCC|nr:preprotein translocase subunit SecY [Mycoplasma capricolum]AJK51717.1 preprotein translocase subunit SecY [Mycoplasma capricolum subsp. capripneumoniae 87001]AQU77668.1 protein translocase subunit SecY [Mycoplasma capricolum subsp. capripneumoniae]QIN43273.1 preprotein translocase subunit SecY [Mycoplasma capricolum subsp. capripneumoniae]QIN46698.1 preprotein translocase subunit SecY [Mycoplasma capricolum subsp. capripneumoniae]QIN48761.1 preprotein translocase subunit SecY [Mycoplasma ca